MMDTTPISEVLAKEAELAEQSEGEHRGPYVRSRRPPKNPSQVYSLRIPLERLESVRKLATENRITPAALLRTWVLERLDEERRIKDVDSTRDALPPRQRERAMALVRQLEATLTPRSVEPATSTR